MNRGSGGGDRMLARQGVSSTLSAAFGGMVAAYNRFKVLAREPVARPGSSREPIPLVSDELVS
jgi:hypothetical protein